MYAGNCLLVLLVEYPAVSRCVVQDRFVGAVAARLSSCSISLQLMLFPILREKLRRVLLVEVGAGKEMGALPDV